MEGPDALRGGPEGTAGCVQVYSADLTGMYLRPSGSPRLRRITTKGGGRGGVCWSPYEHHGLPSFRLIAYVRGRKRVVRSASQVVRWSCQP